MAAIGTIRILIQDYLHSAEDHPEINANFFQD